MLLDGFRRPDAAANHFGTQPTYLLLPGTDGDGRADIVGFGDDGVYISYSLGWSFTAPARKTDQFIVCVIGKRKFS